MIQERSNQLFFAMLQAAERKKALIACCDENRKMMENRINMTEEDENAKEAAVLEQARKKQERAREWRQQEIKVREMAGKNKWN